MLFMKHQHSRQTNMSVGQSLIEMIVVLGLVAVLITSVVVGSTFSLKNQQLSGTRDTSLKYAQQGIELMRSLRDTSWATFETYTGTWCLGEDNTLTVYVDSCTPLYEDIYQRVAVFAWDSTNERMSVKVLVTWKLGSKDYSTVLETYLTDWR